MKRLFALVVFSVCLSACGGGNNGNAPGRHAAANSAPAPAANDANDAKLKRNARKAAKLFKQASLLYLKGDKSGAAEALEKALPLAPDNSEMIALLARTYQKLQRYDEAQELYQRASKLVTGQPLVEMRQGAAYCYAMMADDEYKKGHLDEAVAHIDRSVELRPDSRATQMLRGNIHFKRKEYAPAAEGFEAAVNLSIGQRRYEALSWLGQAQFYQKDYKTASETFSKLIDEGATGFEAYGWRAYCDNELGKLDAAKSDFQLALARSKDPVKQQDYRDALKAIEEGK